MKYERLGPATPTGLFVQIAVRRVDDATDVEEQYVYYYAHLDHYHRDIYAGKPVMRGDTLGYVGTTGNAPKNLPHLHFQVMRWPADGKYWNGDPIDPFEALGGVSRAERARHVSSQPLDY